MSTPISDIYWLAGLLEGEGSFGFAHPKRERDKGYLARPLMQIKMTDKDVIERAARILGGTARGPYKRKNSKHKDYYLVQMPLNKTIQWMMTLFPLMGERRKDKIEEVLTYWKENHVGRGRKKKK